MANVEWESRRPVVAAVVGVFASNGNVGDSYEYEYRMLEQRVASHRIC